LSHLLHCRLALNSGLSVATSYLDSRDTNQSRRARSTCLLVKNKAYWFLRTARSADWSETIAEMGSQDLNLLKVLRRMTCDDGLSRLKSAPSEGWNRANVAPFFLL